ncbi:MAG: hypothetical protein ACLTA1_13725, partial [Clostridia bacterium]
MALAISWISALLWLFLLYPDLPFAVNLAAIYLLLFMSPPACYTPSPRTSLFTVFLADTFPLLFLSPPARYTPSPR